jgi:hypothetical protein
MCAHASLFSLPLPPIAGACASASSACHCRNRHAPRPGHGRPGRRPPVGAKPHMPRATWCSRCRTPPSLLSHAALITEPPVISRIFSPSHAFCLARRCSSAAHASPPPRRLPHRLSATGAPPPRQTLFERHRHPPPPR